MYESHLPIAGGMHKAIEEAARLGMESTQIFAKNQSNTQWISS